MDDLLIPKEHIVETGKHLGYQWAIAKATLYGFNGYIQLPETQPNHPWENEEWICDTENYSWGEVTYRARRWYGFDNMHSWNHWKEEHVWVKEPQIIQSARNSHVEPARWDTLDTVRRQVRHMIEQANEAYTEYLATGTYII